MKKETKDKFENFLGNLFLVLFLIGVVGFFTKKDCSTVGKKTNPTSDEIKWYAHNCINK